MGSSTRQWARPCRQIAGGPGACGFVRPLGWLLAALLVTAGCGGGRATGGDGGDAGLPSDAGRSDGGRPDAGMPPDGGDAGPPPIGNDVSPETVSGGGTTGGAIDGRVNVTVLGGDTDAPLAGAYVQVDPADGSNPRFGRTDSGGVFTVREGGLAGPVDVHVYASGYALTTVTGLAAANLTVVLRRIAPEPRPGTATVSGRIDLSVLPSPPFGASRSGAVLATLPPGGDASDLPPPGDGAVVYRSDFGTDEDYLLVTRTGLQAVYLVAGNADLGGDFEPTHFGVFRGLSPGVGQNVGGIDFAPDLALAVTVRVVAPALPAGTDQLVAIPLVDLGAEGQAALPPLAGGGAGEYVGSLPPLSGAIADGHYDVVAVASKRGPCQDTPVGPSCEALPPQSTRLYDGLDAAGVGGITLDLLGPPVLSTTGEDFGFDREARVSLGTARLAGGSLDWDVWILGPDQTSFSRPQLDPSSQAPALSGPYRWRMDLLVVPGFDPLEARFSEIRPKLTHIAGDEMDVDL